MSEKTGSYSEDLLPPLLQAVLARPPPRAPSEGRQRELPQKAWPQHSRLARPSDFLGFSALGLTVVYKAPPCSGHKLPLLGLASSPFRLASAPALLSCPQFQLLMRPSQQPPVSSVS